MPKPTIAGTPHDRRRKLTDADRAEIRELAGRGWGTVKLSRAFNVSPTAIGDVLDPTRKARAKARLAERGGHYALYGSQPKWRAYGKRWRKANRKRVVELAACGNVDKREEVAK